ncbi:MAG: TRM11 family methyltransferase [Desulfurococcales archaeon]|nr:TRM11 family methyltransferase [Desulfurococcales archaeon]
MPDSVVTAYYRPLALVECKRGAARVVVDGVIRRAGLVKSGGLLLGLFSDEEHLEGEANRILEALASHGVGGPLRVEVHRLLGLWREASTARVTRLLASLLEEGGVGATPRSRTVLEVLYAEGVIAVGLRLAVLDTRGFAERSPARRPFFKPGPLDQRLSRALVNLARLRPGGVFWDPFCGTGGIALEACLLGAGRCLCGDISFEMAYGSRRNLKHYSQGPLSISYIGDALSPPVGGGIDAVATDPPYGRSTTLGGRTRRILYKGFLEAALSLLRRGSYLVFAAPEAERPHEIASSLGYYVVERHYMYVHGSLVREIIVVRAP